MAVGTCNLLVLQLLGVFLVCIRTQDSAYVTAKYRDTPQRHSTKSLINLQTEPSLLFVDDLHPDQVSRNSSSFSQTSLASQVRSASTEGIAKRAGTIKSFGEV